LKPHALARGYRTGEARGLSVATVVRKRARGRNGNNGATLGFEQTLWQAADKLRNNLDAAEYKHVVLGLIFLKYISDAFEEKHAALVAQQAQGADPERIPRRERLLGSEGGAMVSPSRQREAADHRQADRRRDGRDRARQPVPQGRLAQGVQSARPRQAAAR
jgi:hypothetical protein